MHAGSLVSIGGEANNYEKPVKAIIIVVHRKAHCPVFRCQG